jgi:environmental stress-induced protein Ves
MKKANLKISAKLLQQSIPGLNILVQRQPHQRTDHVIAVVRKTMPVGHQNQKQVQQDLLLVQQGQKTVCEKTMGNCN